MIIIPKFLLNRCWVCFVLPDFQDLYRNVNGSHYLYTSIALIRYRSVIHSKKVKCWPAKLALERSPPSYSCKIQTYLIHVVNLIGDIIWTTTHPNPRPSKYHLLFRHSWIPAGSRTVCKAKTFWMFSWSEISQNTFSTSAIVYHYFLPRFTPPKINIFLTNLKNKTDFFSGLVRLLQIAYTKEFIVLI